MRAAIFAKNDFKFFQRKMSTLYSEYAHKIQLIFLCKYLNAFFAKIATRISFWNPDKN